MNAIYVHGLGSGAATNGLSTIAKILSQYKWHVVEVNENLLESVSIIMSMLLVESFSQNSGASLKIVALQ